jgi:hypothetical protein
MTTTDETERWHTEPLGDADAEQLGDPDDDHEEVDDDDGMTGVLIDEDTQETDDDG